MREKPWKPVPGECCSVGGSGQTMPDNLLCKNSVKVGAA